MGYYQDTTFPTATGTLDKSRLENFVDLLNPAYIGKPYVYMQRIVSIDPDISKRGIWVLQDTDHTKPANWKLLGTASSVPEEEPPVDLSNYVLKEEGKTLISIEELNRLSQLEEVDISGKVDKVDGKSLILDSEIIRLSNITNQDISGKVDKVLGKSLLSDTEIARLLTLFNVDVTTKANISYVDSQDNAIIALITALKAGSTETIASLKSSIGALEAIVGGSTPDANAFVTTVKELLEVFSTFPEGVDLLGLISSKVDKVAGKSLLADTEIARLLTLDNVDISSKVDKVNGKSLISDAEIARLATVFNVDISGKENTITPTTTADFWSGAKTFLNFASTLFSSVLPTLTGGSNTPITAGSTLKSALQDLQAQISGLPSGTPAPRLVTGVVLSSTGWVLVSGVYEYSYSNANITVKSLVDFIPYVASVPVIQEAVVYPRTTVTVGAAKVYAKNAPTGNITVDVIITESL